MPTEREYFEEIRDVTFANARGKGFEVVLPSSFEIQLDIDLPWRDTENFVSQPMSVFEIICRDRPRIREVLDRLLQRVVVTKWQAWRSAGGNCHVMLTMFRELELAERIALQAVLGSDPMREMLNLSRAWCQADDPIALFRPPHHDTDEEIANG